MESGIFTMAEPEETRYHFVTFYDGKMPGKEGELKGLLYSSRSHLFRDPPLVKVNKIPSTFLII